MKRLINSPNIEFSVEIENTIFNVLVLKYPLRKEEQIQSSKQLHHHTYYECLFLNDEKNCYFVSEKQNIELKEEDFIIIPPDVLHKIDNIESLNAYKIGFEMQTPHDKTGTQLHQKLTKLLKDVTVIQSNSIISIFNILENIKNVTEFFSRAVFIMLIGTLLNEMDKNIVVKSRENTISNISDSINNALIYYYNTDITSEDLSKDLFISSRQINRICHKLYGKSFMQQKELFRINEAKKLLLLQTMSINEIANQVGYENLPTFYAAFCKNVGKTPKEFIKSKTTIS